ncbi:CGNR zinc finger domain-containing protein [Kribbella deserti]|uniref:CGNR zinc finger domain-containing protein n=1 Tax=Kribbella deserti TaxID=1926257 RepID=A0ABV6QCW6_9ACTN
MNNKGARFYAGVPCLDFANTVEPRRAETEHDFVPDYAALLAWSRQADLLTPETYAALADVSEARDASGPRRASEAPVVYERAIELREAIYRVFAGIAEGASARADDLVAIQRAYAEAQATAVLRPDDLTWTWPRLEPALPVWLIAIDAMELLRSNRLDRLKHCELPCAWLFLDTTKNRSRRWCSMRECGFEEKVRRQAAKRA